MPFSWEVENPWVPELKEHVIRYKDEDVLMLAGFLNNDEIDVRHQLFNFYTLLFDTFKNFPFTSDESKSRELIYKYIITMKTFLNKS